MPDLLDVNKLKLAEDLDFQSPVPTQMISNGEFTPMPQTRQQKQVEEQIKVLADTHGRKQGLTAAASCTPPPASPPVLSR